MSNKTSTTETQGVPVVSTRKPPFSIVNMVIAVMVLIVILITCSLPAIDYSFIKTAWAKLKFPTVPTWVIILSVIAILFYFFRRKIKRRVTTLGFTASNKLMTYLGTGVGLAIVMITVWAAWALLRKGDDYFFPPKHVQQVATTSTVQTSNDSEDIVFGRVNHLKANVAYRYIRQYKTGLYMEPQSTVDAILTFQCDDSTVLDYQSKNWNVVLPRLDLQGTQPKDCGWFTITSNKDVDVFIKKVKTD